MSIGAVSSHSQTPQSIEAEDDRKEAETVASDAETEELDAPPSPVGENGPLSPPVWQRTHRIEWRLPNLSLDEEKIEE